MNASEVHFGSKGLRKSSASRVTLLAFSILVSSESGMADQAIKVSDLHLSIVF